MNTRGVAKVLTWALGKAVAPQPVTDLPGKFDDLVSDMKFSPTDAL